MFAIASQLLSIIAVILAVPTVVFFVEIVAAIALPKPIETNNGPRGRVAALIPAHNEETGLLPTIDDLKQQLRPGDRIVVVADNCTDETAAIAARGGAEVTVRADPTKIGKGYALDWGLTYLDQDPPDVVIVVDADCRLSAGSIDQLAAQASQFNRPVQALYLMTPPDHAAINLRVATFAWRVKNWVRPLGLKALRLPCQLMGTGMAFPWALIRAAKLSSGAIVEDLKLGLDLAAEGHPPLFCPSAIVSSTFPQSASGAKAQRQRWEHGHLGLIASRALPLAIQGLRPDRRGSLAMALDLFVPPLSLLIILLITMAFASSILAIAGGSEAALLISMASLGLVMAATGIAWLHYGREILPPRAIGLIPLYIFAKLRLYGAALLGRKVSQWVRADRG
jgi:cellulose synthase/poly-beta-1,6-N-acetylglucosamine synthase-like glycosyltransferase